MTLSLFSLTETVDFRDYNASGTPLCHPREPEGSGGDVGVGSVTHDPVHGSGRAALPHPALASVTTPKRCRGTDDRRAERATSGQSTAAFGPIPVSSPNQLLGNVVRLASDSGSSRHRLPVSSAGLAGAALHPRPAMPGCFTTTRRPPCAPRWYSAPHGSALGAPP